MKQVKRRTWFCLLFTALLAIGASLFLARYLTHGADWASFRANKHIYSQSGQLISGTILDRSGNMLYDAASGAYSDDANVRRATLHAVGDSAGNIATGAKTVFSGKLGGFNPILGTTGGGHDLYLTIDADLNAAAYKALNGRKGAVGVYNYKTGELLCMVSAPAFDPADPPEIRDGDARYEGVYINRFLSSSFTPGSVFKVVTTAAAIENIDDLFSRTFTCTGSVEIGGQKITCPSVHGTMDIYGALANSCNCVYAQLAVELGGDTLARYAEQAGLLDSLSVSGIDTAAGSFTAAEDGSADLGWSGVGQYNDLVNPCAMMVWMGGVANGGKAAVPHLIQEVKGGLPQLSLPFGRETGTLIDSETAQLLSDLMAQNVVQTYGSGRFPNMDICAKSGTAEVGGGKRPNAWFVGFLRNENTPYAFAVVVEEGGSGASAAGNVAAQVLDALVNGY